MIAPGDDEFPDILAEADPPVNRLWIRGRPLASLQPFISIVGARRATAYGLDVARSFAATLAREGWCVVSGLAKGIDAAAHQGALDVSGATVAVLGSGIDVAYPKQNAWMIEQIVATGALITEYPPGTSPRKHQFPERNRIIARLGAGLVLVQARTETLSGAMSTARMTTDRNGTVFAVPGDVRSELSVGPHSLIEAGTARFCPHPGVISSELSDEHRRATARATGAGRELLPKEQQRILAALESAPDRPDGLSQHLDLDIMAVNRALARLEMSGRIVRVLGGLYRIAR